ncbi:MAG: NBR1-Ig-like domain-containing protein [Chloroflexota bacterium]
MSKRSIVLPFFLVVSLVLTACNMPTGPRPTEDPNAAFTAAAQTVEAQLTQAAALASPTQPPLATLPPPTQAIVTPTFTVKPPTPTNTPICDLGQFIKDISVPDGAVFAPGAAFTKTWRIKNIGVCEWSGYSLVFDSGDAMSGDASKAIGSVLYGQEVDLSIDLKAPSTEGTYRGYWRIRNASGVLIPIANGYQGRSFYVEIKVANPTATPTSTPTVSTVTLTTLDAEDGHVRSDGTVNPNPNVGDVDTNEGAQAFLSFDISGIPAGATITKVQVKFDDYDTLGTPFSLGDGCLRAYSQSFGTLDAADYFSGAPSGALVRWCSTAELSSASEEPDVASAIQNALGDSRFQLRLQFNGSTNSDGIADMVRFGAVKLIVTYSTP